ncbi:MAG: flagellar filament outer layer protein FlaA [Termitinemataceae bacterium]|nr:MAG: flagellar filament outer layer protein FlaA [Termitinemataceae bacterium]
MKRIFIFVSLSLFVWQALFADEKVLIDFTKLAPDILQGEENITPQNRQTVMDFSRNAGTNYTPEQRAVMKTSLAIPNWIVRLTSSSRSVENDGLSFTRVVNSTLYGNVMGVRVHFPEWTYNSNAFIRPPFDIPAYEFSEVSENGTITPMAEYTFKGTPTRFEDGFGIIKNVGAIKSLQVSTYGLNFPHKLFAVFIDGDGKEQAVFLGTLEFDGWKDLSWNNPKYIQEVRSRELRIFPLYPKYEPQMKFAGFRIDRDAGYDGGDCVAYFREVRVVYDKAQLEQETDIDDESSWNIIKEREAARQKVEFREFGKEQVFRFLEQQKIAPESFFDADERAVTP